MLQSVITVVSLALAVAAWASARRARRQLAELTAMYWRLRYDHLELKARIAPAPGDAPAPQAFVPVSEIKRS